MISQPVHSVRAAAALPPFGWRAVGHRVLSMTLLWVSIGAFMGLDRLLIGANWIEVVGHALAGVILLSGIGVVLGLVGGRWREALVGALAGIAIGILNVVLRGDPAGRLLELHVCLLIGAIVGATMLGMLRGLGQVKSHMWALLAVKH